MKTNILDHGYLEKIEHWGSDERIIESARMSTSKGFLGWEAGPCPVCGNEEELRLVCFSCEKKGTILGDKKLLKRLWDFKHCYDSQTEVLTSRGFVNWANVTEDDNLGQWDEEADSLIYEKSLELIKSDYSGQMYRVDHGGVDLLVTDKHKMYVKRIVPLPTDENPRKQGWESNWKLKTVSSLGTSSMIRFRKHAARNKQNDIDLNKTDLGNPVYPPHDDSQAMLRLIGFFLGDGHAYRSGGDSVVFHLKKERKICFLKEVCLELGWPLDVMAGNNYVLRAEGVGDLFRSQFYDKNAEKCVPFYLLDLNTDDAKAILDGLKNSDGTKKRGAWQYYTTSRQLAECVQLFVLHAGGSAQTGFDGYIHRVMVLSRMLEPVINQGKENTSWEQYDGKVYCAHTRTGILVVRRNGKIVLSGNSTPFEFAGLTLEVQIPIMAIREWHRHRTQSYSELSARYTPLPDFNYMPTVERCLIVNATNKQAGKIKGSDELTHESVLEWLEELSGAYELAEKVYQSGLKRGIPKEVARLPVPVGRYTKMRATANLRNWLAFLTLRMDPGAQLEIRLYANEVAKVVAETFPRTYSLFIGEKE